MAIDLLTALPPEVAVGVLSSGALTSVDIRHVARASKAWANLAHFPQMWRQLALRWGLAERDEVTGEPTLTLVTLAQLEELRTPPQSLERPRPQPGPSLMDDWRMIVSLMDMRSMQWQGRALNGERATALSLMPAGRTFRVSLPAFLRGATPEGEVLDLWRFKVLPDLHMAVATSTTHGGLWAIPMDGSETSCIAPPALVMTHSHVEADGEWVVFDHLNKLVACKAPPRELTPGTLTGNGPRHWNGNPARRMRLFQAGPNDQPCAFRMKSGMIAAFTMQKKVYVWDVEQDESQSPSEVIDLGDLPIETVTYIDFDNNFLFVAGMLSRGLTDVYAIRRYDPTPNKYAWSLVCGPMPLAPAPERRRAGYHPRPSEVSRKFMRLHFPGWRTNESAANPCLGVPGFFHGAIRPLQTILGPDPLAKGRWAYTSRIAPTEPWDAVHMDETTGTLVILNTKTLVILRDYRHLIMEPDYMPELEAFVDLGHPQGIPPEHRMFADQFEQEEAEDNEWGYDENTGLEAGTWDDAGMIDTEQVCRAALSVGPGRALIVNHAPILVDFSHLPTRAEDLVVSLLYPRRENEAYITGLVNVPPLFSQYLEATCAMVAPSGNQLYTLSAQFDPDHAGLDRTLDEEEEEEGDPLLSYGLEQWDFTAPLVDRARRPSPPYPAPWSAPMV